MIEEEGPERCLALPTPPSHSEDSHGGGGQRRPRLSVAVSVTPENDRLLGSLTHLRGETLAGCEMEPNKVAPEVTVRPVTPPSQQPVTVDVLRTEGSESIVHLQDHSGLPFYRLMLLCACVIFVWNVPADPGWEAKPERGQK